MRARTWLLLALIAATAVAGGLWAYGRLTAPDPTKVYVFKGVKGPRGRTTVTAPPPVGIAPFDHGSEHRLAILVTDPESGWLGLVRGLRAQGVPFRVTQDPAVALRHKVVLVYPIISGQALDRPTLQRLAQHVRDGGTVVGFNLAGGGLEELFGVAPGRELQSRTTLRWAAPAAAPEAQQTVVSGTGETRIATVGYGPGQATVLARFEDGSTGASCRTVGGQACLLGVDLGALAQRAMNGRAESMARSYVNAYEPSLDVLFRWVRDLYVANEPMPWLIDSAPAGKRLSIVMTHDLDYGRSVANSLAFADALKARGLKGTFFVQTKYVRDYNDEVFFNDVSAPSVRRLVADGMDVGSHTVAHSKAFEYMKLGTGKERYPRYQPFVETDDVVRGATVLGELRISKYLLEAVTGAKVRSFRPGRLSYPFTLPQALRATGYAYSSSITANSVLTHLPFQMTYDRANAALEPIYEFPVTLEDEAGKPLGERTDEANLLLEKLAREHGTAVILIHPNITDHKLRFEEAIADRWATDAWIGSLADFGAWWAGRDGLETDLVEKNGRWVLQAAAGAPARGVTVRFPKRSGDVRLDLPKDGRSATILP